MTAGERDKPAPLSVTFDPTDMGTGTVQANGTLYVGREHADEDVRWLIEYDEAE